MKKRIDKKCCDCLFGKYFKGKSISESTWICNKNPLKPVRMGILGVCSERNIRKSKQYPKNP